jgi:hypothetical protein
MKVHRRLSSETTLLREIASILWKLHVAVERTDARPLARMLRLAFGYLVALLLT